MQNNVQLVTRSTLNRLVNGGDVTTYQVQKFYKVVLGFFVSALDYTTAGVDEGWRLPLVYLSSTLEGKAFRECSVCKLYKQAECRHHPSILFC